MITFENEKHSQQSEQSNEPNTMVSRMVRISQVITESELVNKSKEFEQALEYGNFVGVYTHFPACGFETHSNQS